MPRRFVKSLGKAILGERPLSAREPGANPDRRDMTVLEPRSMDPDEAHRHSLSWRVVEVFAQGRAVEMGSPRNGVQNAWGAR